jgi:hypothetical protein
MQVRGLCALNAACKLSQLRVSDTCLGCSQACRAVLQHTNHQDRCVAFLRICSRACFTAPRKLTHGLVVAKRAALVSGVPIINTGALSVTAAFSMRNVYSLSKQAGTRGVYVYRRQPTTCRGLCCALRPEAYAVCQMIYVPC